MQSDAHAAAIERIERALSRIERAAQVRAFEAHAMDLRHDVLRERMQAAIVELDAMISADGSKDGWRN